MKLGVIGLSLVAALAAARPCSAQCGNVNLLSSEGCEELLASGNVPGSDWPQLIDCVFDWIDADNEHRLNGAESDDPYYVSRGYSVSNAPLAKVTDLLLVKGFDHAILYGGTNQSGVVLTGIVYRLTTWSTNGICDCDGDSMPDWYEDGYSFLNPTNPADGAADQDADFLSNAGEYERDTDPTNSDTDGDRMLASLQRAGHGTTHRNPESWNSCPERNTRPGASSGTHFIRTARAGTLFGGPRDTGGHT